MLDEEEGGPLSQCLCGVYGVLSIKSKKFQINQMDRIGWFRFHEINLYLVVTFRAYLVCCDQLNVGLLDLFGVPFFDSLISADYEKQL